MTDVLGASACLEEETSTLPSMSPTGFWKMLRKSHSWETELQAMGGVGGPPAVVYKRGYKAKSEGGSKSCWHFSIKIHLLQMRAQESGGGVPDKYM